MIQPLKQSYPELSNLQRLAQAEVKIDELVEAVNELLDAVNGLMDQPEAATDYFFKPQEEEEKLEDG